VKRAALSHVKSMTRPHKSTNPQTEDTSVVLKADDLKLRMCDFLPTSTSYLL
jgi:hypothetical protein